MGMPITVEIGNGAPLALLEQVFAYFHAIDRRFSTYKSDSEISEYSRGEFAAAGYCEEVSCQHAPRARARPVTRRYAVVIERGARWVNLPYAQH